MPDWRINMSQAAEKVWSWLDSIAGPFYSPGIRRYLTLRWITVFVLVLFVWNLLLKLLLPIAPPAQLRMLEHAIHSPLFLVPFDTGLLIAILFLIGSKPRSEYDYLRALFFGVILAAFLGECLVLFVPWRR
jgi:hypothetical protein